MRRTQKRARVGIGRWIIFYNEERLHQALGYQTPKAAFEAGRQPVDMMDIAAAMTTSPQAQQQQKIDWVI